MDSSTRHWVDVSFADRLLTFFYALTSEADFFGVTERPVIQTANNKDEHCRYFELVGVHHRVEIRVFDHIRRVFLSFNYNNAQWGTMNIRGNGTIDLEYSVQPTLREEPIPVDWAELALNLGRKRAFMLPERVPFGWVNTKTRRITAVIVSDKPTLNGNETAFCVTPYVLQHAKLAEPLMMEPILTDNTVAEWLGRFWRAAKQGRIVRLATRIQSHYMPPKAYWRHGLHYLQFGYDDGHRPVISTEPYAFCPLHGRMLFLGSPMENSYPGLNCIKQHADDLRLCFAPW